MPYFIKAFDDALAYGLGAKRTPFRLERIDQVLADGDRPIWRGGAQMLALPRIEDIDSHAK
ncbi:hypothetical protein GTO91_04830 [Heliobacterium undosum]|uniref:Uncharacterized protein n=1 Tax=Heliomicrobium undosum TaxID=121734 RepID=A0A845L215_9FIRM|nr:hypothetical protein [Heliomicrobium undosum]MZP29035.1 hypothetical protein [Heliomicrobium undosum]